MLEGASDLSPAERTQLALCKSALSFILESRKSERPETSSRVAQPTVGEKPILIVEDDAAFRQALVAALSPSHPCIDFGDAESALVALGKNPGILAFLLDYRLPGMSGIEFLATASRRFPLGGVPAILLTSLDDESIESEAYGAGTVNFLRKPCAPEAVKLRLEAALKQAREVEERTRSFLRSRISRAMEEGGAPASPLDEEALARFELSAREIDVARLIANGLQAKEIADGLGLSPHTVANHIRNIYEKCGVSNRIELLRRLGRP